MRNETFPIASIYLDLMMNSTTRSLNIVTILTKKQRSKTNFLSKLQLCWSFWGYCSSLNYMPEMIYSVFCWGQHKIAKNTLFWQFKDYNSERKHGNCTNDPILNWKYSKFIFMWFRVLSILVCKITQFLAKIY